ncbi:MAG: FG-GAP-like repeat-containing protein [Alphaproteobacteria bacterium]
MATYTHLEVLNSPGATWADLDAGYISANSTLVVLANTDGTLTGLVGSGFTFTGSGSGIVLTGGTISQVGRTNGAGTILFEQITDVNYAATAFQSHMGEPTLNGVMRDVLAGADTLTGFSGTDVLIGGPGSDVLDGKDGTNIASYQNALSGVTANLGDPSQNTGDAAGDTYVSIQWLFGSPFNDTLIGDANLNFLRGGPGADTLDGGTVDEGLGGDFADYRGSSAGLIVNLADPLQNTGEAAGDTYRNIGSIRGSFFNDTLVGDANDNNIRGGGGADVINGGAGSDFASYADSPVGLKASLADPSQNTGEAAGDTYISIENLAGSSFDDTLIGDAGNNILQGHAGSDILNGGAGVDTASYSTAITRLPDGSLTGVVVDLLNPNNNTGEAAGDTYSSIENLRGGNFNDILFGDNGSNLLVGDDGNDALIGNGGNDTLVGGNGNDTLQGGLGNDVINGGTGTDNAIFAGPRSAYTITLSGSTATVSGPDGTDTLSSVEYLFFDDVREVGTSSHWLASSDIGPHPAGWLPIATDDFNHDATSDVLWFNSSTLDLDLWKLSNGKWSSSVDIGPHPAGYQPSLSGDFNADGTADVLWYNPANGDVDIWKISSGQWAGSVAVGPHPLGWQPATTGDFNNDGTSDVLWFNPTTGNVDIWKMQNGQWAGSVDVGPHPLGYTPIGTGDFNNDGTSDVLWFNPVTRDVDLWKISDGHWAGSTDIGTHPAGYAPAGIGDFNGDGMSDLAWFNATTGDFDIWLIADGHWSASMDIGLHPAGWTPAGVGDFNQDAVSDILWRETATNRVEAWLLGNS